MSLAGSPCSLLPLSSCINLRDALLFLQGNSFLRTRQNLSRVSELRRLAGGLLQSLQNRSTVRSKKKSAASPSDAVKAAPLVRQDSFVVQRSVSSFIL